MARKHIINEIETRGWKHTKAYVPDGATIKPDKGDDEHSARKQNGASNEQAERCDIVEVVLEQTSVEHTAAVIETQEQQVCIIAEMPSERLGFRQLNECAERPVEPPVAECAVAETPKNDVQPETSVVKEKPAVEQSPPKKRGNERLLIGKQKKKEREQLKADAAKDAI